MGFNDGMVLSTQLSERAQQFLRNWKPEPVPADPWLEVLEHYANSGEPPIDTEGETPCRGSEEFRDLEGRLARVLETTANSLRRAQQVTALAAEANEKFCGHCPIRERCLAWAKADGNYEGFAGGEAVLADRPPLLELPTQIGGRPLCKCHGHPMQRGGVRRDGRVEWRCPVRRREQRKRYEATPRGRAVKKAKNRRYYERKKKEVVAA